MKSKLTSFLLLFISCISFAHNPENEHLFKFTENKGQWENQILYRSSMSNLGDVFIVKDGLVYNFIHPGDWEIFQKEFHDNPTNIQTTLRQHAYKIKFEGANQQIQNKGFEPIKYYQNFFLGNDRSKWASHVRLYEHVQVENIYNNINLVVKRSARDLKYDFVVKPGGSPNNILLSFEGVQPKLNKEGALVLENSINTVIEEAPYVYQNINGKEVAVKCNYKLIDNKLSFELPESYNTNYELIIDPRVIFSTYSGAVSAGSVAYSHSSTCDADGNMYAVAYTFNTGWPTTFGSFQQNFAGFNDIGVNKIWEDGSRLEYSTYYGGTNNETPLTSRVNSLGQLLIGGMTTSTNLPLSNNPFKGAITGNTELFFALFSADGSQLVGSTYYGNSGRTGYYFSFPGVGLGYSGYPTDLLPGIEINFDINNNIWIVANVENATNIPTSSNGFQLTKNGGFDVIINKFNPTLSNVLYGSYFGGAGDEVVHGIELLSNGNPVIIGGTTSTDLPIVGTSPYLATAPTGAALNGFVAVLNETTGQITNSTYIGTTGNDVVSRVDVDGNDNIFILGRNIGAAFPITTGSFTNITAATENNQKIFIMKLNTSLSQVLTSTAISGTTNFTPGAFIVDECSNIYFTSMGGGAGMPMSLDAFQTNTDDLWFAALDGTMQELIFGTYYGDPQVGDHCHTGTNRFDKQGRIYHSICVFTASWPTTPSSYCPIKLTSGYDVASFKFDFDKTGVNATITPDRILNPIDSGCVPHTVAFNGQVPQARQYFWDFGDGNTSIVANPTHTYTVPGTYDVMLVAINDSLCITHDTAYLTVKVYEVLVPQLSVVDTNLCTLVDSLLITVEVLNPSQGVPGNVFSWTGALGSIYGPGNTQSIYINPSLGNQFNVVVIDSAAGVCQRSATAVVNVNQRPRILEILTPDTAVCNNSIVPIRAIGSNGYTYKWAPTLGVSDTNALEPNITVTQSNIYMVTASYPFCIDTSDLIYIDMHEYPVVDIIAPTQACEGTEITINSDVTPFRNDYIYTWEPNQILGNNPNTTSVRFIADTVDRFYKLTVSTPIGCSGADSAFIVLNNKGFGDAIAGAAYCPPGSAQLWASNGISYQWIPAAGLDDPTSANPTTTTRVPIDYQVLISDVHHCVDTLTVKVNVYPRATLSIPETTTIYPGGEGFQVEPETNALYFSWYPPSGVSNPDISDPILNPLVRTRYFVTAKTEFGCEVKDSIDVLVGAPNIHMPNAYNPNHPDFPTFKPILNGGWNLKSFRIYNRWGTLIFETTQANEGWDGKFKDEAQPFGVYVWSIEATHENGQELKQTGNVTLIR